MAGKKKRIVSGVQPTASLHVGNYLGAIKNFLAIQDSGAYDSFFFIADLHSLTIPYEPKEKGGQIYDLLATYLALGLDPKKTTIFLQSQVTGHTELSWLLSCVTPIAELERMTQYKDKAAQHKKNVNAGLFTYPVLQAADVLLYNGELVPVGEDQVQHVELIRVVARKMNAAFGTSFPESKPLLTKAARVMSLKDPVKKMSKSLGGGHVLNLFEDPELIRKTIAKATTSTEMRGPAYDNLMLLLNAFSTDASQRKFSSYRDLKESLAEAIIGYFSEPRKRFLDMRQDITYLDTVLDIGRRKAQAIANETLKTTKRQMGLPV